MFYDEAASELRPSCKEIIVNSILEGRFCGGTRGCMKERCQRREERVGDRCCWLGAVAVEVGEAAVQVKLEQATVSFPHGKFCREGVH